MGRSIRVHGEKKLRAYLYECFCIIHILLWFIFLINYLGFNLLHLFKWIDNIQLIYLIGRKFISALYFLFICYFINWLTFSLRCINVILN